MTVLMAMAARPRACNVISRDILMGAWILLTPPPRAARPALRLPRPVVTVSMEAGASSGPPGHSRDRDSGIMEDKFERFDPALTDPDKILKLEE